MNSRRDCLRGGAALLLSFLVRDAAAATKIIAVRSWPAADYTRVTIESDLELKKTYFLLRDPHRLVVDIEGVELSSALKELVSKIDQADPYIRLLRIGRNSPTTTRMVFDLKEEVAPQVFALNPVDRYAHRLIFDLYPARERDPISELLERQEKIGHSENDSKKESDLMASPPPQKEMNDKSIKDEGDKTNRLVTVTIDPGHGGEDPGAIGRGGSREKDVVLAIAKKLRSRLEALPGVRVLLTRDGDYFVPLHHRVQKARRVRSDLFISIHADAWVDPQARGSSVFILSEKGASSTAARWLAAKENASDLIGGAGIKKQDRQLASVLLDLSTTAQIKDSMLIGRSVLGELESIGRLHKGRVEQAGFAVLKAPDIPSILVETAFISNPEEEAKLSNPRYQEEVSDAIMRGIKKYIDRSSRVTRPTV